jgi:hypothetical protein
VAVSLESVVAMALLLGDFWRVCGLFGLFLRCTTLHKNVVNRVFNILSAVLAF